jgi:hypothetical protein
MLRAQVIEDHQGTPTGVFIPIKVWESLKHQYPDIENLDASVPQWEKDFIDKRLKTISQHPEKLKPIHTLFENL